MTFNVSDAERLAVVRSAVAKFAMDIMAPVVCNTETGTVEVVATLKGCREHVRTKEFLWRSSTAPPTADAKDAEIAKLRAERDEAKRTLVSLFDDTKAEMKRLRSALAAARAALDGEREQHDETQRALNLGIEFAFDAADGRPGIETACEVIAKFDQRRAAEAKASRGGDHVADAGQMVAAAQEPKP